MALFAPLYGSLLLEIAAPVQDIPALAGRATPNWVALGKTTADPAVTVGKARIELDAAQAAWERPLARVFPPVSGKAPENAYPDWASQLPPAGSPGATAFAASDRAASTRPDRARRRQDARRTSRIPRYQLRIRHGARVQARRPAKRRLSYSATGPRLSSRHPSPNFARR
jgi:hypothetical protein